MSGLFQSLSSASNALNAQRTGLDVVGQNIANVNTPGYTRRMILLGELPPPDFRSAGRGVEVLGVQALRDTLVEARIRREQQGLAADSAVAGTLTTVDAALGLPGASLDARLTAFFDAFSSLTNDVRSPVLRDGVVQQGTLLARAFNDTAAGLTQARSDADRSIRDAVSEVNQLTAEVAALNRKIADAGPDVEELRDRQNVALGRLSELMDVAVLQGPDGTVDVTTAKGGALVLGISAYALTVTPSGTAAIQLAGVDVTADITGGRIGGLVHARDAVVPTYQSRLDQLAFDLATAVNTVHTAGFDATGTAAGNFFVPPSGVAGAAAALAVDPALAADSSLVAGSATGAVGDNQAAQAIASLRTTAIGSGNATAFDAWGDLVQTVGGDVIAAQDAGATREQVLRQLQRLRDQASGVSLDEEAANLMKFQRAYEANARYFTTIVDALDALMDMVR